MLQIQKKITKVNRTKINNKENKYIVIHYTGNNGDTAKGNCNYFENVNRQSSAHYFVDENSIWQCVEDYDVAWHVGGAKKYYNGCRNNNSIGVELCSRINADGEFIIKEETIKNADAVLFALNCSIEEVEGIERFIDCEYYEVDTNTVINNTVEVLKEIEADIQ